MKLIGVISYTHGLLREEAVRALNGVDLIIHAGDIGSLEVIVKLREIGPVTAVRGNCDRDRWTIVLNCLCLQLIGKRLVKIGGIRNV